MILFIDLNYHFIHFKFLFFFRMLLQWMWLGCVIALIVVAIDRRVRRAHAHDVQFEARRLLTVNESSGGRECIVVLRSNRALFGVDPGQWAAVAFPFLDRDDFHPFTIVWRRDYQHEFHVATSKMRMRAWTNELDTAIVAARDEAPPNVTQPALLYASVTSAFRSELADPVSIFFSFLSFF